MFPTGRDCASVTLLKWGAFMRWWRQALRRLYGIECGMAAAKGEAALAGFWQVGMPARLRRRAWAAQGRWPGNQRS